MDIENVREYCLSLPHATEDQAFGEEHLLFRVFNKIFACLTLEGEKYLAVKCNPEYAIELRERYSEIEPAYHWNKKYWNQIHLEGSIKSDFIKELIQHSYTEVTSKLPKAIKNSHPEILLIK